MSSLTALFIRNSSIFQKFTLPFYEKDRDQTGKAFITRFGPQWKDRESSYQVRLILVLFPNYLF